MSYHHTHSAPTDQTAAVKSLWTTGLAGRILTGTSDCPVQVVDLSAQGATIRCGAVFQIGEPVILTLNGAGNLPGRIVDRAGAGVRLDFDAFPQLAQLIAAARGPSSQTITR